MKKLLLLCTLFTACLFMACSDDKEMTTAFDVQKTLVNFGPEGGSETLVLTAASGVEVSSNAPDWCTATLSEGKLVIDTKANTTGKHRTALVTVKTADAQKTIRVEQNGAALETSLKNNLIEFNEKVGEKLVVVETTLTPWTVTVNPEAASWVTLTQSPTSFTVSVPGFLQNTTREATITLTAGTGETASTQTIRITQTGKAQGYEVTLPTDFSTSYIQKATVNGVKVAEVCREYLRSSSLNVDKQTTVIYPVKNGVTDYSKGLTVEGDMLSWNMETNTIASFTPGTATVKKVYVVEGELMTTFTGPMQTATIQPEYLVDNRSGDTPHNYKLVKIGTQIWMAENLRAKKYTDGTDIANPDDTQFTSATAGAWRMPGNSADAYAEYGAHYNGYAVLGKLAPEGWGVPTNNEWLTMRTYVTAPSGNKLRNTTGWDASAKYTGTNVTGFTAKPSGYFIGTSQEEQLGFETQWWTSTPERDPLMQTDALRYVRIHKDNTSLYISSTTPTMRSLNGAMAVRLMKKK